MQIMIVRKIKENELMESRNISSLCFNWSNDTEGKDIEALINEIKVNPASKGDAYYLDIWVALTDEEEMMSCINVIPYEVTFDENKLKMAGIGNVCTYPQHRRKGAVRECFRYALKEMYERGNSFSFLYPFSEKFYGNFGYSPFSASTLWSFDLKAIPNSRYDGAFHLYHCDGNYTGFDTAYQLYAEKYNMMVHRDSYDWDILKSANPFKGNRSAYLYTDNTNKACGYIIFEGLRVNDQGILDCKEIVFDSFQTLKAIMSFVKTFSADYLKIQFAAPASLNLDYFCEDFSQSPSSRSFKQNGMVRVVNVKDVLSHAIFKGSGELKLLIHDSYIIENQKIFDIIYKDGHAVNIRETNFSESTQDQKSFSENLSTSDTTLVNHENVDIEMTINQFSAAIVGKYDVSDFDYQEGITLFCNKDNAAELFYRKPCWINNYF